MLSILPRRRPKFGSGGDFFVFDAVIKDNIGAAIEFTSFPLEIGAVATDHGIIQPKTYSIEGGVSDNPLSAQFSDFAGGFLSNLTTNTRVVNAAAFSAGYLAGSKEDRGNSTLEFLFTLMYKRIPFDIDTGQVTLTNMVFTNITTKRDNKTEGALMFNADFQELPLLRTLLTQDDPSVDQMNDRDDAQTMAAISVSKGRKNAGIVAVAASAVAQRLL